MVSLSLEHKWNIFASRLVLVENQLSLGVTFTFDDFFFLLKIIETL